MLQTKSILSGDLWSFRYATDLCNKSKQGLSDYWKKKKVTLVNPFLLKLMKGRPIMITIVILPTEGLGIEPYSALLKYYRRFYSCGCGLWACFAQKKSFDQLFVEGSLVWFFVKVFIGVWPWENIGDSGAFIEFGTIVNLLYESIWFLIYRLLFDLIKSRFWTW